MRSVANFGEGLKMFLKMIGGSGLLVAQVIEHSIVKIYLRCRARTNLLLAIRMTQIHFTVTQTVWFLIAFKMKWVSRT